jgi:hypothetical protein
LTLRSADWGSGKPIEGVVQIGERERAFSFDDPFAPR